jgi:TrmH family RNA methyltransferase
MLSKNNIKYLHSLKLKKFRQKYDNFVVEGDKIAKEMLQSGNVEIENIYALASWIEANESLLQAYKKKLLPVTESELKKITLLTTPNEVLIVAKRFSDDVDTNEVNTGLSLFVDGIQDPGNMGTIIRTADWFGIKTIFCSTDTFSLYNAKVLQATMGAFLRVRIIPIDFTNLASKFPELPVYGTVLGGENIFRAKLGDRGIIVIGNEGQGISDQVLQHLDFRLTIPSDATSGAESLNAAVAAGIICAIFRNYNR